MVRAPTGRRNIIALLGAIWLFAACSLLPGGQAYESATVVYSAGSKKHTAAVQVPVAAPEVYASFVRLLEEEKGLDFQSRNDKAMLIEVEKGSRSLTGQVTDLGANRSLLYVWADARLSVASSPHPSAAFSKSHPDLRIQSGFHFEIFAGESLPLLPGQH